MQIAFDGLSLQTTNLGGQEFESLRARHEINNLRPVSRSNEKAVSALCPRSRWSRPALYVAASERNALRLWRCLARAIRLREEGAGSSIATRSHLEWLKLHVERLAHERSQLFSLRLYRRVCRRLGSRRAEARRNRSPRCLRGTMPCRPRCSTTRSSLGRECGG